MTSQGAVTALQYRLLVVLSFVVVVLCVVFVLCFYHNRIIYDLIEDTKHRGRGEKRGQQKKRQQTKRHEQDFILLLFKANIFH